MSYAEIQPYADLVTLRERAREEIAKVVVGQDRAVDLMLVAALALFAYYKPQKKDQELRLSTLKPADAKTVKIEIAGTPPVELERSGADWLVTAPVKARADAIQAQRVLEILEATAKDSFPPQGLARYDLNEPPVKLTINQQSFA